MRESARFLNLVLVFALVVLAACQPMPASQAQDQPSSSVPHTSVMTDEEYQAVIDRFRAYIEKAKLESGKEADPRIAGMAGSPDPNAQYQSFVEYVSGRVDTYWREVFTRSNMANVYVSPGVEIETSDIVEYGMFKIEASRGPFYYPPNQTLYLPVPNKYVALWRVDDQMTSFAAAYLVAHEWGHHIENLLQLWDTYIKAIDSTNSQEIKNILSQGMELQADCFAGTWANSEYYKGTIEPGDIEAGIALAVAIGDDVLSHKVDPAEMDHGSSEQRKYWFMYGYNSGNPSLCMDVWNENPSEQTLPQPQPTSVPQQELDTIQSFFVLASDPSCQIVEDSVSDTLTTHRCTFTDGVGNITVDYDEWMAEQAWTQTINIVQETRNPVLNDSWHTTGTSEYSGPFVAWVNNDGKLILLWGVYGYRLTGTMYWYNDDAATAQQWFLDYASQHNLR